MIPCRSAWVASGSTRTTITTRPAAIPIGTTTTTLPIREEADMRTSAIPAAILALFLLAACGTQQPARPPQSASPAEAASNGLSTLRSLVNSNNYRSMGFESLDEVQSASLGEPLPVYMVRLDQLREFQPGGDPEKLLGEIGQQLYPVLVNGAPRSAVVVEKQGEQWSPVSYGGANLVKALGQRWSENAATMKTAAPAYFEV